MCKSMLQGVSTAAALILILVSLSGCTLEGPWLGKPRNHLPDRKGDNQPTTPPIIESISPTSGTIGTEIVIRGSGFTPDNNDIAFTHQDINFRGRNTAYLNQISSPDGKTLRFTIPDLLGACAFSQMKPNEACPDIGIGMPVGHITISVVNSNGISNGVVFERTKSEIEIAQEIIYNSPSYQELIKILDEIVRRTGGSIGVGIRKCEEKICIIVWIEKDVPELSQKIPAQIEGFEVRIEKWGTELSVSQITLVQKPSVGAIFTVEGQGIKSLQTEVFEISGRKVFDSGEVQGNTFTWNLQNNAGQRLANGIYLYVVRVRGFNGEEYVSEVRKLVILH